MTWKALVIFVVVVITLSLIELSITESRSPLEQQRSLPPGGSPGAAQFQPRQPDVSPPWQPPQLEWSSQTHSRPHCHSSSPVPHRVHHKQWERPIESDVQCPVHSAMIASHAYILHNKRRAAAAYALSFKQALKACTAAPLTLADSNLLHKQHKPFYLGVVYDA